MNVIALADDYSMPQLAFIDITMEDRRNIVNQRALDAADTAAPRRWAVRHRRFLGLSVAIFLLACIAFLGGFALFTSHVARLTPPSDPGEADGIIVLTGGHQRLKAAVNLLQAGNGERLLISGVNPIASREELRNATGADASLFNCCVDIDMVALDTVGNARESARWLRDKAYGRVIVVTNNYHIPRSLFELHRLADDVELVPYPVVGADPRSNWLMKPAVARVLFIEYVKYVTVLARSAFSKPDLTDAPATAKLDHASGFARR